MRDTGAAWTRRQVDRGGLGQSMIDSLYLLVDVVAVCYLFYWSSKQDAD